MPGSSLQLATSRGIEGTLLTGNPTVTYYKNVFKRYTNFAMENLKYQFKGSTTELDFKKNIKLKLTIPKTADLLSHLYFSFTLPDIYSSSFLGREEQSRNNNSFEYLVDNYNDVKYHRLSYIPFKNLKHTKKNKYYNYLENLENDVLINSIYETVFKDKETYNNIFNTKIIEGQIFELNNKNSKNFVEIGLINNQFKFFENKYKNLHINFLSGYILFDELDVISNDITNDNKYLIARNQNSSNVQNYVRNINPFNNINDLIDNNKSNGLLIFLGNKLDYSSGKILILMKKGILFILIKDCKQLTVDNKIIESSSIDILLKLYLESYDDKRSRGVIEIIYGNINLNTLKKNEKLIYTGVDNSSYGSNILPLYLGILNTKDLETEIYPSEIVNKSFSNKEDLSVKVFSIEKEGHPWLILNESKFLEWSGHIKSVETINLNNSFSKISKNEEVGVFIEKRRDLDVKNSDENDILDGMNNDYLNGKIIVQPDTGLISKELGDNKTESVLILDISGGDDDLKELIYHDDTTRRIKINWRNYIKSEGYRGRVAPFFENWDIKSISYNNGLSDFINPETNWNNDWVFETDYNNIKYFKYGNWEQNKKEWEYKRDLDKENSTVNNIPLQNISYDTNLYENKTMVVPGDRLWGWINTNLEIDILDKYKFIDLGGNIPNDRKNRIQIYIYYNTIDNKGNPEQGDVTGWYMKSLNIKGLNLNHSRELKTKKSLEFNESTYWNTITNPTSLAMIKISDKILTKKYENETLMNDIYNKFLPSSESEVFSSMVPENNIYSLFPENYKLSYPNLFGSRKGIMIKNNGNRNMNTGFKYIKNYLNPKKSFLIWTTVYIGTDGIASIILNYQKSFVETIKNPLLIFENKKVENIKDSQIQININKNTNKLEIYNYCTNESEYKYKEINFRNKNNWYNLIIYYDREKLKINLYDYKDYQKNNYLYTLNKRDAILYPLEEDLLVELIENNENLKLYNKNDGQIFITITGDNKINSDCIFYLNTEVFIEPYIVENEPFVLTLYNSGNMKVNHKNINYKEFRDNNEYFLRIQEMNTKEIIKNEINVENFKLEGYNKNNLGFNNYYIFKEQFVNNGIYNFNLIDKKGESIDNPYVNNPNYNLSISNISLNELNELVILVLSENNTDTVSLFNTINEINITNINGTSKENILGMHTIKTNNFPKLITKTILTNVNNIEYSSGKCFIYNNHANISFRITKYKNIFNNNGNFCGENIIKETNKNPKNYFDYEDVKNKEVKYKNSIKIEPFNLKNVFLLFNGITLNLQGTANFKISKTENCIISKNYYLNNNNKTIRLASIGNYIFNNLLKTNDVYTITTIFNNKTIELLNNKNSINGEIKIDENFIKNIRENLKLNNDNSKLILDFNTTSHYKLNNNIEDHIFHLSKLNMNNKDTITISASDNLNFLEYKSINTKPLNLEFYEISNNVSSLLSSGTISSNNFTTVGKYLKIIKNSNNFTDINNNIGTISIRELSGSYSTISNNYLNIPLIINQEINIEEVYLNDNTHTYKNISLWEQKNDGYNLNTIDSITVNTNNYYFEPGLVINTTATGGIQYKKYNFIPNEVFIVDTKLFLQNGSNPVIRFVDDKNNTISQLSIDCISNTSIKLNNTISTGEITSFVYTNNDIFNKFYNLLSIYKPINNILYTELELYESKNLEVNKTYSNRFIKYPKKNKIGDIQSTNTNIGNILKNVKSRINITFDTKKDSSKNVIITETDIYTNIKNINQYENNLNFINNLNLDINNDNFNNNWSWIDKSHILEYNNNLLTMIGSGSSNNNSSLRNLKYNILHSNDFVLVGKIKIENMSNHKILLTPIRKYYETNQCFVIENVQENNKMKYLIISDLVNNNLKYNESNTVSCDYNEKSNKYTFYIKYSSNKIDYYLYNNWNTYNENFNKNIYLGNKEDLVGNVSYNREFLLDERINVDTLTINQIDTFIGINFNNNLLLNPFINIRWYRNYTIKDIIDDNSFYTDGKVNFYLNNIDDKTELINGKYGAGAKFCNSHFCGDLKSNMNYDTNSTKLSLIFNIKFDTLLTKGNIFTLKEDINNYIYLKFINNELILIENNNLNEIKLKLNYDINENEWYNFIIIKNGLTYDIYINNLEITYNFSYKNSTDFTMTLNKLILGKFDTTEGESIIMNIDCFTIYNRIITNEEKISLFNGMVFEEYIDIRLSSNANTGIKSYYKDVKLFYNFGNKINLIDYNRNKHENIISIDLSKNEEFEFSNSNNFKNNWSIKNKVEFNNVQNNNYGLNLNELSEAKWNKHILDSKSNFIIWGTLMKTENSNHVISLQKVDESITSNSKIVLNGKDTRIDIGNENNVMFIKSNFNKNYLIQKNYAEFYKFKFNGKIIKYNKYKKSLRNVINNLNDGDILMLDNGSYDLDLEEVETTKYNNSNCVFKFNDKNNLILGNNKTIIKTKHSLINRDIHLTTGLNLENTDSKSSSKIFEIRNIILEFNNYTNENSIEYLERKNTALHGLSTNNFKFVNCVIILIGNRFSWGFDNNNINLNSAISLEADNANNIVYENCTFLSNSESYLLKFKKSESGDLSNIVIKNCIFELQNNSVYSSKTLDVMTYNSNSITFNNNIINSWNNGVLVNGNSISNTNIPIINISQDYNYENNINYGHKYNNIYLDTITKSLNKSYISTNINTDNNSSLFNTITILDSNNSITSRDEISEIIRKDYLEFYYKLDSSSNNIILDNLNKYNGIISGDFIYNNTNNLNYINLNSKSNIYTNYKKKNSVFSLFFWINFNNLSKYNIINTGEKNDCIDLKLDSYNNIYKLNLNNTIIDEKINKNEWYHIGILGDTITSNKTFIYLNKVLKLS